MEIAIGENYETAILGFCILSGLLFTDERVLILRFCFQYYQRKPLSVQQEEVDKTRGGLLEVLSQSINHRLGELDGWF